MKRRSSLTGFTFVEILLVCSLFSVIAIALFHSLLGGLKIWERGQLVAREDDVALFLEKISLDLANTISFSQISFSGYDDRVAFATLVKTQGAADSKEEGYLDQIGRVEYFFDRSKGGLYYHHANYSLALKQKYFPDVLLVKDLRSVKFQYYYRTDAGFDVRDKAADVIPAGLIIEVNFGPNKDYRQMRRIIPIPIGS